jgi:plastocyanin
MKPLMLVLATGLLLTGYSSASSPATKPSSGGDAVRIQGITFAPGKLTVTAGTSVTWTNKDNVMHTVTSGKPGEDPIPGVSKGTKAHPSGVFDHSMSPSGATFTFSFKKPGIYPYFCKIHSSMRGVIAVH